MCAADRMLSEINTLDIFWLVEVPTTGKIAGVKYVQDCALYIDWSLVGTASDLRAQYKRFIMMTNTFCLLQSLENDHFTLYSLRMS